MTKSRKIRCKMEKDKMNLEVLELLNDEKPEEVKKEVTKEKLFKLTIVLYEKNSNEKLSN